MSGIKLTIGERGMSCGNSRGIMCIKLSDTSKSVVYPWFLTVDKFVDLHPERLKPHYPQGTTSTPPL
jgi:hypothetical protein